MSDETNKQINDGLKTWSQLEVPNDPILLLEREKRRKIQRNQSSESIIQAPNAKKIKLNDEIDNNTSLQTIGMIKEDQNAIIDFVAEIDFRDEINIKKEKKEEQIDTEKDLFNKKEIDDSDMVEKKIGQHCVFQEASENLFRRYVF